MELGVELGGFSRSFLTGPALRGRVLICCFVFFLYSYSFHSFDWCVSDVCKRARDSEHVNQSKNLHICVLFHPDLI